MTQVRVSIDNITVTKDGDPSGKGELYWLCQADSAIITQRSVNNPDKRAAGTTIPIGSSVTLTKNPGQVLLVFGSVSDKDGGSRDETASFAKSFTDADNWGVGPINETLVDGPLDVTVNGRIELV